MANIKQFKIGSVVYDLLGHKVLNAQGTEIAQRLKLQFGGGLAVTDDSQNAKTLITVNAASSVTKGDNRPVTANAVYNVVGDVESLLSGI